jgi:Holliday junction resolvase-like predicted endonuclease
LTRIAPLWAWRWLEFDARERGWLGECVAAHALRRSGARIVARRARVAGVEVDLVIEDARGLACVEVKFSTVRRDGLSSQWRPAQRVDHARLVRQRRAAGALSRGAARAESEVRCDVIEVWLDEREKRVAWLNHRDVERPIG